MLAAEVDRARERLACHHRAAARTARMQYEIRVVTGETDRDDTGASAAGRHRLICCGTEGKSVVDALFSGSVSEKLFVSGRDSHDDRALRPARLGRRPAGALARTSRAGSWCRRTSRHRRRAPGSRRSSRPADAIGELHALHVLPESARGSERRETEVMLEGLLDMAREHDIEAMSRHPVRRSHPGRARLPERGSRDGVITGQHGRGRLLRKVMLGGLSLKLLRDAPCPVVVQP